MKKTLFVVFPLIILFYSCSKTSPKNSVGPNSSTKPILLSEIIDNYSSSQWFGLPIITFNYDNNRVSKIIEKNVQTGRTFFAAAAVDRGGTSTFSFNYDNSGKLTSITDSVSGAQTSPGYDPNTYSATFYLFYNNDLLTEVKCYNYVATNPSYAALTDYTINYQNGLLTSVDVNKDRDQFSFSYDNQNHATALTLNTSYGVNGSFNYTEYDNMNSLSKAIPNYFVIAFCLGIPGLEYLGDARVALTNNITSWISSNGNSVLPVTNSFKYNDNGFPISVVSSSTSPDYESYNSYKFTYVTGN